MQEKNDYINHLLALRNEKEVPEPVVYDINYRTIIRNTAMHLMGHFPDLVNILDSAMPVITFSKDENFIYYTTMLCWSVGKPEITLRFPIKYWTAADQIMHDFISYVMTDKKEKFEPRFVQAARFGLIYEIFEVPRICIEQAWPKDYLDYYPDLRAIAIGFTQSLVDEPIINCHLCQKLILENPISCNSCDHVKYCSDECFQSSKVHRELCLNH